jgi:hypothetical protein
MSAKDSAMGVGGLSPVGSSHAPDPVDPPPVGVDPLYSDCVIRSTSGKVYYTLTGALATCSPVFRGLVDCCVRKQILQKDEDSVDTPQKFPVRNVLKNSLHVVEEDASAADNSQSLSSRNVLEVPLEDPDEEIEALVEQLHQPERFLGLTVPVVTKEGTARILHLGPIAFKYDIQGNFNRFEAHSSLVNYDQDANASKPHS